MPSQATSDSKQKPLFVVHAIEGFVAALLPLASKLSCPVWGLQCTLDAPLMSLRELAVFYVQQIKTVQPKGPYTIAGYSYGAAVAFEMVVELERLKETAQLIMFDGSPKYVNWFTNAQRLRLAAHGEISIEEEESLGLAYFGMVCAKLNYGETAKELLSLESMEDRLARVTQLVHAVSKHPIDLVCLFLLFIVFNIRILINFYSYIFRSLQQHDYFSKNLSLLTFIDQKIKLNLM